jgi:RNA polymerase sigma-70 factor (ECF subfamily)
MDFEELYDRFFKDVYLFVLAMSKNPDVAEEITQETFFKALKELKKFKGNCSVKSWLCQIAKNLYLDQLKKKQSLPLEEAQIIPVETNIELALSQKEEALSIYKVLHLLEDPFKEVFTLRVLGELSFREIGEIFHKNESWARVTYHRAKLKIQDNLK